MARDRGGFVSYGIYDFGSRRESAQTPKEYRAVRDFFDIEEIGDLQVFTSSCSSCQGDRGECRGNHRYLPDMVRLGGCWGVKLGQIVIIFRE